MLQPSRSQKFSPLKRWGLFIKERFEPLSHFLMIACFFGANYALDRAIIFSTEPSTGRILIAFIVTLLFFFHLRLFDELKDYQADLHINPTRPLPRGLIELKEFRIVLMSVIGLEVLLASLLGPHVLTALLVPLLFSFLMYKEFFIGNWLRPKMEAYAISHTLVSAFLALFIACAVTDSALGFLPQPILIVMFMNWMVFNTFEFARKTYSREEERENVETYSQRWGEWGASIWVFAFTFLAMIAVLRLNDLMGWKFYSLIILAGISLAPWVAGIIYSTQKTLKFAKLYRGICAAYLVLFNFLLLAFGLIHLI